MKRNISELEARKFDLVIIGAGITGACIALDGILRGMSVAIVEKGDFGAATSSASSKLLHGGIRYLQQGKFLKVRESAFERAYFQSLAPHLTRYVPFVIPTYRGISRGKSVLKSAIMIYEALCLGQNRHITDPDKKVPAARSIDKQEIRKLIPGICLDDVTGGFILYESHMLSSERMTLGFLDTAARRGAVVANYVHAESFLSNGSRVFGIRAKDLIEGHELEIHASVVVNAAGPWIPLLNNKIGKSSGKKIVTGLARGTHIVTRPLTEGLAVALPTRKKNQALINRGGRHIFMIPWRGHTLIGTTYGHYHGNLDEVHATESDVMELIEDINSAIGDPILKKSDVLYAYAGLYPLIEDRINANKYQGTGNYQIIDHMLRDEIDGLVSVFGAKYTTARILAEKALDLIVQKFNKPFKKCQTRYMRLDVGNIPDLEAFRRKKVIEYASLVPSDVVNHLITTYGTAIDSLLALVQKDPKLGSSLSAKHDVLVAEVIHAVEQEMAYHLDDFIFRRTGLGTLGNPGTDVILRCGELMANKLGWNEETKRTEIRRTTACFFN